MRLLNGLLLLSLTIFLPPAAPAQTATAALSGTVLDQNGALVPDALITISNTESGLRRQVATSNGFFSVPLLPPGNYTLKAQRQGFATLEVNDLRLNVNDQLALRLRLQVGQISESVAVEGASLIQTESSAVGTVINRQFVENLPLNGRSFHALIELTPGTVLTKGQGQFSINGQRDNANYFSVDGVSANIGMLPFTGPGQSAGGTLPAFNALGGTSNLVSVDALQEFRIQTSTYAAEFGRTPGGQVAIVTRAGTNQFRATLFDYFRNDALDANDWFANSRGLQKPPLRQNDFGGVFGGPLRKDRTFFFFSYEGLRLRQPQVALTPVPSIQARQAAPAQIQPLLNAFPVPNGRALGDGFAEFSASYSDSSTLNATSIRIDHQLNGKLSLFGRYNDSPSELAARGGEEVFNDRSSVSHTRIHTQTLTIGATQTFSSRISNDLRANYSRNQGANWFNFDDFGGATPPADSALFPPFVSRQDASMGIIIIPFGFFVGRNADHAQRQFNLVDNLAFVTGPHQFKLGGDYRRLSPIINPWKYTQLVFFDDVNQALTGNTDFITFSSNSDRRVPLFTNFSAYAQDTWKLSSRLILTYGLRWELNPSPSEKHGKDAYTVIGLDNPATMTLAPKGTPLWQTTYNNFAPRVGAAYLLSQERGRETVLRGGFGIFYDLGSGPVGASYGPGVFGYSSGNFLPGVPFPLDPAQALPPPVIINPPYGGLFVFDPQLKLPRVYQGDVAVEQSLGTNQTISATYVAALGRRLLRGETFVSPNPSFFSLFLIRNAANSDYHALQLQFKRRLSHGLAALASYTWSHSIDGVSDDRNYNLFSVTKFDPKTNRGPSDFDVRQSFSAAFTYDIPSPAWNRLTSAALRGWSVDAIFRARSATPVNVTGRVRLSGVYGIRPDVIPGVPLYVDDPAVAGGRRINSAAFAIPSGRQGNLGRNALRGFAMSQIDMAVRRQFNFGERLRVQLRADFFNILNHPNFADPEGDLGRGAEFGESLMMLGQSLGGFNPLYQIGGPRSVQLALKVHF